MQRHVWNHITLGVQVIVMRERTCERRDMGREDGRQIIERNRCREERPEII